MTAYHLVHFQNPALDKECAHAAFLRDVVAPSVLAIRGIRAVQFLALQPVQLQPPNVQPWRMCSLYELETTDLEPLLKVFSSSARHRAKAEGLVADDAAHVFELTRPQLDTRNAVDSTAPLYFGFVMGNCVEGKESEYEAWYDEIHSPEVLGTPDFVGMRRGRITQIQALPENVQPANRLVLLQIRSHDLYASIHEFIARAFGTSPSGVMWQPRELAAGFASMQRTTHVFTPFSPRLVMS